MSDLWRWSAAQLAEAIRTREISSREALSSVLARSRAVNPALNAFVEIDEEAALQAADEADRAVARGDELGILHGVPVSTKVNVDQRGKTTTNGLTALRENIATDDSPVVANLRKAGAVLFARSNTPAFSMRWFTENELHGRTLNPWSEIHTPGGSSGGASAAVASGMGPIGHGNDLAGSVRYPAYCTGIYGLRPSFGRVPAFVPSATEERPLSMQLMSVQGPLARTVRDIELALSAMAAGDARDPWWVPVPLQWPSTSEPIRVAMTTETGSSPAQPAVVAAVQQAAAWLQEAGYVVEQAEPPRMSEAIELWDTLCHGEVLSLMRGSIERLGDQGIRHFFTGMTRHTKILDAAGHMRALATRTTIIRDWMQFMQRYPLVLGPVSSEPALPWGLDTGSKEQIDRVRGAQGPQFLVPVLGLPSMAAPTGLSDGLPMGVQITGARFREDMVIQACRVLEARHPSPAPIDPIKS
jgi:amidase